MNFEDKEIYFPLPQFISIWQYNHLQFSAVQKTVLILSLPQHAAELGKLLAENNIRLIYGGGSAGMMGIIADSVMEHGGQVTGIIPETITGMGSAAHGITELIICDDMHERKKKIYSVCDAAMISSRWFWHPG